VALVGPLAKVRDELSLWKETVLTTMILTADQRHLTRAGGVRPQLDGVVVVVAVLQAFGMDEADGEVDELSVGDGDDFLDGAAGRTGISGVHGTGSSPFRGLLRGGRVAAG